MNHTDFNLMAQWLSTKEVLEFYGDIHSPFTLEQVKQKYEPRVNGEIPVQPYIVELDNSPIGFIQQYKVNEKNLREFGYHHHQNVYGIDQFIGVPEYFNQGIGTVMVKKFIKYLHQTTDAQIIILDPEIFNARAIRCYEKCGFVKVKKIYSGKNWLMEIRDNVSKE